MIPVLLVLSPRSSQIFSPDRIFWIHFISISKPLGGYFSSGTSCRYGSCNKVWGWSKGSIYYTSDLASDTAAASAPPGLTWQSCTVIHGFNIELRHLLDYTLNVLLYRRSCLSKMLRIPYFSNLFNAEIFHQWTNVSEIPFDTHP